MLAMMESANRHIARHPPKPVEIGNLPVGRNLLGSVKVPMAVRDPSPLPVQVPDDGPVKGLGQVLNFSTAAEPFSHGLTGVNQAGNYLYGDVLTIVLMAMLAIALAYVTAVESNRYLRRLFTLPHEADQRYWMNNRSSLWAWIKRHIISAPLFRIRHNKEIQLSRAVSIGTLPSRLHTCMLIILLALNLLGLLALGWGRSNEYSVVAELRGRSGHMAALQLIPTVLLALRNNPLISLLGTNYDTMNLLHRWFARIVIVEVAVHVICWMVNNLSAGGAYQVHLSLATSTSFQWGLVAACCFFTIGLAALGPVRHAFYESFICGHRLLVLLALIGIWIHLAVANLPQLPFIASTAALWIGEWTFRIGRVAYHNLSTKRGVTKVTVQALPAEACRVTFDLVRPWHWQPGCSAHVYFPFVEFGSSHPFSVAWGENRLKGPKQTAYDEKSRTSTCDSFATGSSLCSKEFDDRMGKISIPRIPKAVSQIEDSTKTDKSSVLSSYVTSVSCVIRARTGMTRKLYDKAMAAGDTFLTRSFTTTGFIEGPYGGTYDLCSYGTVVLFAGGIGITHAISFVHHLLLQHQLGHSSTRKVLLVWSVPNTEALEWIRPWMDQILRMENRRETLRIHLFVTKPRHRQEVISNTGSVQMFPGRCNPLTIMEREMPERIGAMAVTMCGPGVFADAVRSGVRSFVEKGVVDFIEDSFTY